jgi:hypothetical protein
MYKYFENLYIRFVVCMVWRDSLAALICIGGKNPINAILPLFLPYLNLLLDIETVLRVAGTYSFNFTNKLTHPPRTISPREHRRMLFVLHSFYFPCSLGLLFISWTWKMRSKPFPAIISVLAIHKPVISDGIDAVPVDFWPLPFQMISLCVCKWDVNRVKIKKVPANIH